MKIGIIGLGACATLWENAISVTQDDIVVECDTNTEFRRKDGVPFFASVDDLIKANVQVDYFIVATGVKSHYDVAAKLLMASKNIIIEKPVSYNLGDVFALKRIAEKYNANIITAYHASFSEEVLYFVANKTLFADTLGEIKSFASRFYDPYVVDGKPIEKSRSLYGSYLDSCVNALSVLHVLFGLQNFKRKTKVEEFIREDNTASHTEYMYLNKVYGSIETDWTKGVNHKETQIDYEKGSLILNHSEQRIEIISNGFKQDVICKTRNFSRLLAQYVNLLEYVRTFRKDNIPFDVINRLLLE